MKLNMKSLRSVMTDRQRKKLEQTTDKARREKLLYNYEYDASKRAALKLNLIKDLRKVTLRKPKKMSQKTFKQLESLFEYPNLKKFFISS